LDQWEREKYRAKPTGKEKKKLSEISIPIGSLKIELRKQ